MSEIDDLKRQIDELQHKIEDLSKKTNEEQIIEHTCDKCNGSGKIKFCKLCQNTGYIVDGSRITRCPNGCPEQLDWSKLFPPTYPQPIYPGPNEYPYWPIYPTVTFTCSSIPNLRPNTLG